MADYKEMITDTLNSLVGKAKEFAGSETVTGFVDKVKNSAGGSQVYSVYEQGSSRAKAYGRIAKLSLEVNGDHEELSRIYKEIGKLYYEQAKDAPEGYFAPLFAQAAEVTKRILDKETEVQALKDEIEAAKASQDIDVEIAEFEEIVDATASDGAAESDAPAAEDKTEE